MLEGQDARVEDDPVADLDGPPDRVVRVPRPGAGEHRAQVRKQGLAYLPGGGVPQVGRAVVHGVIERRGGRP